MSYSLTIPKFLQRDIKTVTCEEPIRKEWVMPDLTKYKADDAHKKARRIEIDTLKQQRQDNKRYKTRAYDTFLQWVDKQSSAFSFVAIKKDLTMEEKSIRSCLRKAIKLNHVMKASTKTYKKGI